MRDDDLRYPVLEALAYFDVFDYPLTVFEAWQWLVGRRASVGEVETTLRSLVGRQAVETRNGFFALRGRLAIVETRMQRSVIAERKFQRAVRMAKILRHFPFVRSVGVCNSLAYGNARRESDIDIFLITSPGRVWTARFFTAALLKLLGLRPTPTETEDRFCLSFFVSRDALSLEHLKIGTDDPYLAHWVAQVVPVCDDGVFEAFWRANAWIRAVLPNAFPYKPSPRRRVSPVGGLRNVAEWFFAFLPEAWFRTVQLRMLPAGLKRLANLDTRVVLTDTVLKFHENDRRTFFRQSFELRLAALPRL